MRLRERLGHPAWKHAELAPKTQVVADRPVLAGLAVLEADDVDPAEGDGLVGGARPMNSPVCRPWKVQWTTVSPSVMTWWISKRRSENPRWSYSMAWIMPSSPGGAPAGGSWFVTSGCITAARTG
jgi:hypothetical protein